MKVSRKWLQLFFDKDLPTAEEIADALTFHVFEIEEMDEHGDDTILDVKVLPDRAAYGLSHRGVAYELGAILNMPLKDDPLRGEIPQWSQTDSLKLTIDTSKCNRHMGALVRGVKVGPSPAWLKESLEAIGQRSINNIVDATNFVTFHMGQPLHAFDAGKITWNGNVLEVGVRETRGNEEVEVLTGEKFTLPDGTAVICEGTNGRPLDIAGIKGGMASAITEETKDIFISVANFDGTSVRKTSQALKLWTDASLRFQNRPSPELVPYAMRQILSLVEDLAGGSMEGVVDIYPAAGESTLAPVVVSAEKINSVLGSNYSEDQMATVFTSLDFTYENNNGVFTITAPFERRDIVIPEDLAEEVGRILGYDAIPATQLPPIGGATNQSRYRGIERIKDLLIERGFTELSTQSFSKEGDVYLANPLDTTRPALRPSLADNMRDALVRGATTSPRVIGPATALKLFDIGMVFTKQGEHLSLAIGYVPLLGKKQAVLEEVTDALRDLVPGLEFESSENVVEANLDSIDLATLGTDYEPKRIRLGSFRTYSIYPFALRDIAVWTPAGTEQFEVEEVIVKEAGELLVRIDLFDRYEKKDDNGDVSRISYAFRLVFESMERTLSDADLNPIMSRIANTLNEREEWEVR